MDYKRTSDIFNQTADSIRSKTDESIGRGVLFILIASILLIAALLGSAYAVFGVAGLIWAGLAIVAKMVWDKRAVWIIAAIGALLCFGFFPFLLVVSLALLLC